MTEPLPPSPSNTRLCYLRTEGVNLSQFVFDTRDLSTIRGGGLTLLAASKLACSALKGAPGVIHNTCRTLSSGASIGVFEFRIQDNADLEQVRSAVEERLRTKPAPSFSKSSGRKLVAGPPIHHATFVVDVVAAADVSRHADATVATDGSYALVNELLVAKNRVRQLQASSVSVPPKSRVSAESTSPICALDGMRPRGVFKNNHGASVEKANSQSVHLRKKFGEKRAQSANFYHSYSNLPKDRDLGSFARDFNKIAAISPEEPLSSVRHLSGKLAVFYADGNSFGSIQRELGTSPERQQTWDHLVRGYRSDFLTRLLSEEILAHADWRSHAGSHRFETLLWGGDEFLFVMPAWQGLRVAQRFFEWSQSWNASEGLTQDDKLAGFPDIPLTHAAALVFCHCRSPIHRIKQLAKDELAEFAKGQLDPVKKQNVLAYQVLESFDHLGSDVESAWQTRIARGAPASSLLLQGTTEPEASLGECLSALEQLILALKQSEFPRGQLRSAVGRLVETSQDQASACVDKLNRWVERELHDTTPLVNRLAERLGNPWAMWWHVEELWDYVNQR